VRQSAGVGFRRKLVIETGLVRKLIRLMSHGEAPWCSNDGQYRIALRQMTIGIKRRQPPGSLLS